MDATATPATSLEATDLPALVLTWHSSDTLVALKRDSAIEAWHRVPGPHTGEFVMIPITSTTP